MPVLTTSFAPAVSCAPACEPNIAKSLPAAAPAAVAAPATTGPVTPPTIPVTTEQCGGTTAQLASSTVQALIPAGTVIYTRKCQTESEFDTITLCAPEVEGYAPIFVVISYSAAGIPTSTAYEADGSVYSGSISNLIRCTTALESDPTEMCDGGTTTFIRWFVKDAGVPNGTIFNTTLTGAPYIPVGAVSIGSCAVDAVRTYAATVEEITNIASTTITPNTDLVSWTVRKRSGVVTLKVGAGAAVTLDSNETVTIDAGTDNTGILSDVVVIEAAAGSFRLIVQRRV